MTPSDTRIDSSFFAGAAETLTAEPVPTPNPTSGPFPPIPVPTMNAGGSLPIASVVGRASVPPCDCSTTIVRTGAVIAFDAAIRTSSGLGRTLTSGFASETLVNFGLSALGGSVAGHSSGTARNAATSPACTPIDTATIDPVRDNPRPPETAEVTRLCSNIAAPRQKKMCAQPARNAYPSIDTTPP